MGPPGKRKADIGENGGKQRDPHPSRIDEGSTFYTKVVPILLGAMAVLTVVLILIAAGVLLGIVPFR